MRKKIMVEILTILLLTPVMVLQTIECTKASGVSVPTRIQIQGQNQNNNQDTVRMTCCISGPGRIRHTSVLVPQSNATHCFEVFHQLRDNLTKHPFSEHTQQLKEDFINLLAQNKLIPASIPPSRYCTLLNPPWLKTLSQHHINTTLRVSSPERSGIASAVICDMSGEGVGLMFPFIMLPRPRIVTVWMGFNGDTIVGKFLTIGGFVATGQQFGTALGFWGIGFAVAYPYGNIYGFAGYALFVTVTADEIESYPPNEAPVITNANPANNAQNVPLTLPELSFTINDPDGDLMSYTVTTDPDIGSGSGNLKPSGTYTVPIHGLQDYSQYSWTIAVSDKQHITEETLVFTTQASAPVVTNPQPADGAVRVPTDLQQLQFTLKDFQGDTMNYTVETSPFIGSGSGTNVHDGTFYVPVSGLLNLTTYRWYVNATDGNHWTRKSFTFQTWFPTHFDPFEHGWQYRKQITIYHTSISDDLTNFPVLVNIIDSDLQMKAQTDGDDIIFMNASGYATLLNFETEKYDGTTGTLIAWVNLTQISSTYDSIFYMYYGNPTMLSLQNPEQTWDDHYVAVWHFKETSGLNVADSTKNHFNATANTNTPVTVGQIGNGRYFDMVNSEIYVGTQAAFGGLSSYSIEAWALPKTVSGEHRIFDRSESSHKNTIVLYQQNSELYACTNNADLLHFSNAFLTDTWSQVVCVFTGSGGEGVVYKNGVKGTPITTTQTSPYSGSITTYLGRACVDPSSSYRWYGTLDEIRFSNIARSAAWISVSYLNQNNPTSFFSIGPEETSP